MNKWSVQEKASQQLVTEENFQQAANPIARIFMFLLCCVPGFLALFLGAKDLPKTLTCKPQGNIAQCQETQHLLNIPLKSRTFTQKQKILQPTKQNLGGTATPVLIGIGYIFGITSIVLIYSSMVTTRKVWIFDRQSKMVINKQYNSLHHKKEKQYPKQDIFGVVLEISDLCVETNLDDIDVRINLQEGDQPTRPQGFNALQPIIFQRHHERLSEAINTVAKPVSAILQVPYQLKFFTQDSSFIFEFEQQYVDAFIAGDVFQIPFEEIQGFEIEKVEDREVAISVGENSFGANTANEYTYRLFLTTKDGEYLQLHQAYSKSADSRREREDAILSLTDNKGYQWMNMLQKQLEKAIRLPETTKA